MSRGPFRWYGRWGWRCRRRAAKSGFHFIDNNVDFLFVRDALVVKTIADADVGEEALHVRDGIDDLAVAAEFDAGVEKVLENVSAGGLTGGFQLADLARPPAHLVGFFHEVVANERRRPKVAHQRRFAFGVKLSQFTNCCAKARKFRVGSPQ
ncbi:MAG: hypothetical protein M5R36_19870 [Deltaproteobacteria bacterium]|nr:hypothetical protein [Deltaproteobacteria bacterium]